MAREAVIHLEVHAGVGGMRHRNRARSEAYTRALMASWTMWKR
jgi:hypothetical protein